MSKFSSSSQTCKLLTRIQRGSGKEMINRCLLPFDRKICEKFDATTLAPGGPQSGEAPKTVIKSLFNLNAMIIWRVFCLFLIWNLMTKSTYVRSRQMRRRKLRRSWRWGICFNLFGGGWCWVCFSELQLKYLLNLDAFVVVCVVASEETYLK